MTGHLGVSNYILQTVQILIKNSLSLLLINNWDSSHPNATFKEMFCIAFGDDTICGPIEVAEHELYIAGSLLATCARSIGILNTLRIVGSLVEGLGFSDNALCNYHGDLAEIAAVSSCIQLLCGASWLMQGQLKRFVKYKILAVLDSLQISPIDTLVTVHFMCMYHFNLIPFNIVHEITFEKGSSHRSNQQGDC